MLKIREYAYIENRKKEEGVQDWLVKEYHDIDTSLEIIDCEDTSTFNDIITYLKREINKLKEFEEKGLVETFLKSFFETIVKENITARRHWVNYLDTMEDERYVEDGEILYEYESDYWAPVAVRGPKEEVDLFIKKMLEVVGFKFEDLNLDLSELEEEFEGDEYEEEGSSIDRAYYEQRPRRYSI